jgi:hypothetical protein
MVTTVLKAPLALEAVSPDLGVNVVESIRIARAVPGGKLRPVTVTSVSAYPLGGDRAPRAGVGGAVTVNVAVLETVPAAVTVMI